MRWVQDFWKIRAPLVMTFCLAQNAGKFLKAQRLLDSLQGLLHGVKYFIMYDRSLIKRADVGQGTL